MRQNIRNGNNGGNRFLSQLAAQKKKTVIALCLIALMGFMWLKVLIKKAPQTAAASPAAKQESPDVQMGSQLKVSFIDLPEVPGRNDVITKDFFDVDGWQEFVGDKEGNRSAGIKDVNVASGDGGEEVAHKVAEELKLEAIVLGKDPQVFINGKLLSQGDKLLINDGMETYECEVVGIEEKAVFIRCGKAQITLKLAQEMEANQ